MTTIHIRFHGQLNDFLPRSARDRLVTRTVPESPAVKDVIESIGVPHVEVDAILADGRSVGFRHRVHEGEHLEVHPLGAAIDVTPLVHLVPPRPDAGHLGFVCDGHLARLAAYLRMLGIDTAHTNHADDGTLAEISAREDRILLSQDRGLLKRSIVRRGYAVRAAAPREQLREVVDRFALADAIQPFSRCLRCNTALVTVEAGEARARVPPRVAAEQERFRRCPTCDALYWPGSHHARMQRLIEQVLPGAGSGAG